MNCRTVKAVEFRSKLGFNQQDVFMYQEQSILSKIKLVFSAEKINFQHCVLGY